MLDGMENKAIFSKNDAYDDSTLFSFLNGFVARDQSIPSHKAKENSITSRTVIRTGVTKMQSSYSVWTYVRLVCFAFIVCFLMQGDLVVTLTHGFVVPLSKPPNKKYQRCCSRLSHVTRSSIQGEDSGSFSINRFGGEGIGVAAFVSSTTTASADARAGVDGYSVSRRPITESWDPNVDPELDIQPNELGLPSDDYDDNNDNEDNNDSATLRLQKERASAIDSAWWSNRSNRQGDKPNQQQNNISEKRHSSENKNFRRSLLDNAADEADSLDLFERTLETLDYYRVLRALYDECTTVPARMFVQQQEQQGLQSTSSRKATSLSNDASVSNDYEQVPKQESMTEKSARYSAKHQIAFQPLSADSVLGSQERYRAVQEMLWLLTGKGTLDQNGRNNIHFILEDPMWRDRFGFQQPLLGRPAPLGGNSFNLQAILGTDVSGQQQRNLQLQRVLEGHEILSIVDIMDQMENIALWNRNGLQQQIQAFSDDSNEELSIQLIELTKIANCISVNNTLQSLLHNAFEQNGNSKDKRKRSGFASSATRQLSGSTFPKIGLLREQIRSLKVNVMNTLNDIVGKPSVQSNLALDSGGAIISEVGSTGRLVIPIRASHAPKMGGIVHEISRSGKTAFLEPSEIIEPTNRLRQLEQDLHKEEIRVWRMLTEEIVRYNIQTLEISVAAVGQLDLIYARCMLGRKLQGTIPVVRDEGVIHLENAKHPVLLLRENKSGEVVGSTLSLGAGANQGLVLTGPNAGGKTVVLKLLGLVALMARNGIPIPANPPRHSYSNDTNLYQPRVDFFNPVLADIGDLQSVGSDLSTFSGHMLVCREVLNNAGRNALVLMDELGSGTDPAQGVAIAQAMLEALVDVGARVVITTHYMQLKQLAASDERFAVAGMQFVQGRPTYKLLPGTVGESFALAVAERLKLPPSVLERASQLLDSETRQMGDLLRELDEQKSIVDEQISALEQKRKEMEDMERQLLDDMRKMEREITRVRKEESKKFAAKLEEKEQILADVLEKLKSDPSRRIVAKSWNDIKLVKRDAIKTASSSDTLDELLPNSLMKWKQKQQQLDYDSQDNDDTQDNDLISLAELHDDTPDLKPGDTLVVCKQGPLFGRHGTILQLSNNSGRNKFVELRVNNMNIRFKFSEVALPPRRRREKLLTKPQTGSSAEVLRNDSSKSISRGTSISKAAERAIASENTGSNSRTSVLTSRSGRNDVLLAGENVKDVTTGSRSGIALRTDSNTVNVLGCNFLEAQEKIQQKFSSALASNRKTVYILHGHGTGGVLKSKIRAWLRQLQHKSSRQSLSSSPLIQSFAPADRADGGDALTRVELQ